MFQFAENQFLRKLNADYPKGKSKVHGNTLAHPYDADIIKNIELKRRTPGLWDVCSEETPDELMGAGSR
nr:hypothetical protein BgiMline_002880 [Biomphalaria glabrata]